MIRAGGSSILVIGLGNVYRCDDGVGIVVARRLKERKLKSVLVEEASIEGTALMDRWQKAPIVFLIDAVAGRNQPGTIHRLDASRDFIPKQFFNCSTHDFGLSEAVELAKALNQLPASLIIYGIEGKMFETGTELSQEVEKATWDVETRILEEINSCMNII